MRNQFNAEKFKKTIKGKAPSKIHEILKSKDKNVRDEIHGIVLCYQELLRQGEPIPDISEGTYRHAARAARGELDLGVFLKYWDRAGMCVTIGSLPLHKQEQFSQPGFSIPTFSPGHPAADEDGIADKMPENWSNDERLRVISKKRILTGLEQKLAWAEKESAREEAILLSLPLTRKQWAAVLKSSSQSGKAPSDFAIEQLVESGAIPSTDD